MQGRNRDTNVENKRMNTKGGERGCGGKHGGGMNWEIGVDTYIRICIKLITNKKLLYKKIKFKYTKIFIEVEISVMVGH